MRELHAKGGTFLNAAVVLATLLFGACAQEERLAEAPLPLPRAVPAPEDDEHAASRPAGYDEIGIASWYGGQHQGRRTASGARFDRAALTAAHPSLPFGTLVRVENLANHRSVTLSITDRGPYVAGRVIDLSQAAARRLGLEQPGIGLVGITVLPPTLLASAR